MIEREELIDALTELMDGDLSEGAIGYIADDLLEKFVLFKNPGNGVVTQSEDGRLVLDGRAFPNFSVSQIEEWQNDSIGSAEFEIHKLMEARGLLAHHRKVEEEAKVKRREKIAQESGGTFDELPGMLQTLITRLVDAEFKNARN